MIEIITGRERRRRWGIAEKLRIVAESEESGARICDIAARYDVCPSLLHNWRRLAREGRLTSGGAMDFVPVQLTSPIGDVGPSQPPPPSTADHGVAAIEVVLPSGGKVLIRRDTPVAMLRAVIAGLRG
jgi:transposase